MSRNDIAYRQTQNALVQLQQQQELILQSVGEGIYGLDAEGRATFVNRAAVELLGWTAADMIGKRIHDFHHHSYADGSPYPYTRCPIYAALRDGKVHHDENELFWSKDGRGIAVEYTSTPIIQNGEIAGAVVVFRDISERKRLQRAQQQALAEITELKNALEQERDYLREEVQTVTHAGEFIGTSQALQHVLTQIEAVAATPASVLILGETGVGKELAARAIHAGSLRAGKPLIKVNCASIPRELFESEFFGHVRGAFTGAHRDRVGRFQLADGGTLFLDEIGEIPPELQSKLLRALQEQEFERVGDDKTYHVDVRIVAASNRNLRAEAQAGRFRQDLYYRLAVFPLEMPPLRERREDILPLADHFLQRVCRDLGRTPPTFSQRHVRLLQNYSWPGNVRELQHVIERAVILSPARRLRLDLALPEAEAGITGAETVPVSAASVAPPKVLTETEMKQHERENILAALEQSQGRIFGAGGAAELLQIKPTTLAYRMKALAIKQAK